MEKLKNINFKTLLDKLLPPQPSTINKIKYFKPTIIEGFWGNKIIWEERQTPLTDEETRIRN